jgi:CBS domain-containing protein
MSNRVATILKRKGDEVFSIAPDATLAAAAAALADHNVGALVVSTDGQTIDGILSERDIVRRLAGAGPDALERPVADVMSTEITICGLDTTIDELMATMTARRIRHIPVVVDGGLAGLVSIGDVVKFRLDELEVQATTLQQYVTGSLS